VREGKSGRVGQRILTNEKIPEPCLGQDRERIMISQYRVVPDEMEIVLSMEMLRFWLLLSTGMNF
jgi:hypothetical protein